MNVGRSMRACVAACFKAAEEANTSGNNQLSVASAGNCDEMPATQQPKGVSKEQKEEYQPLIGDKSQFDIEVDHSEEGDASSLDLSRALSRSVTSIFSRRLGSEHHWKDELAQPEAVGAKDDYSQIDIE